MMKSHLLDLPNELFFSIFQHVPSIDLVDAFNPIPSCRLHRLIRPFLSHLDLSQRTNQWLDAYLPDLLTQQSTRAVRLDDRQLPCLTPHLSTIDIESMHIRHSDWTTDVLKQILAQLRQRLKHLCIKFTYAHGQGDIAGDLFQSDSSLEHVVVTGRFLYFHKSDLNISPRLTSLTIEIEDMRRLFLLLQYLPRLEQLKVT
jgi:hypothetical protein